jgi:ketosteroid isomerase-like protein
VSQANIELARRFYEVATSKADMLTAMPRIMGFCDPNIEWTAREDGSTYRGREGVREALERWLDSFDDYRFEIERIIDCGDDQVLVVGVESGTGAASGVEISSLNYELLTIRDGMIVRYREFYDERAALEAAGLSE